jgi:hypothetical protein
MGEDMGVVVFDLLVDGSRFASPLPGSRWRFPRTEAWLRARPGPNWAPGSIPIGFDREGGVASVAEPLAAEEASVSPSAFLGRWVSDPSSMIKGIEVVSKDRLTTPFDNCFKLARENGVWKIQSPK